jgi:hypothetical protein
VVLVGVVDVVDVDDVELVVDDSVDEEPSVVVVVS